jgi:uncharacterized repeat protein (TIGR01451 family)
VRQGENEEEVKGEKVCQQRPEGVTMTTKTTNQISLGFFALTLGLLVVILSFFSLVGLASAETRAPGWQLTAQAVPTNLPPGGTGFIEIELFNVGAVASSGQVTVTDVLPAGVTFVGQASPAWSCAGSSTVTCTTGDSIDGGGREMPEALGGETIALEVTVPAGREATEESVLSASGGGALETATLKRSVVLSETPAEFGVSDLQAWASNPDGTIDTRAGSHPYELGVSFDFNDVRGSAIFKNESKPLPAGSETRDVTVNLPPGLVGDPQAPPRCPRALFDEASCPAATQIGVDDASVEGAHYSFPVYNLVPAPGLPAQFAFTLEGNEVLLDARVRSGGDYGITVSVEHIVQKAVDNNRTIIWGVPSDPSHDPERCTIIEKQTTCNISGAGGNEQPFLTMPSQCSAPLSSSVETDAWLEPNLTSRAQAPYSNSNDEPIGGLGGCPDLSLNPTIGIAPDTTATDTPAGLGVDIKVPQQGLLDHEGLAPADLKNTKVVLPAGVVINPGQAVGLGACQPGPTEPSPEGVPLYPGRDNLPFPGPNAAAEGEAEKFDGPADCPSSAQVGTDEIESPLIAKPLQGAVYIMQSDPPDLELLLTAEGEGVYLKLLGHVELDEATGQLTTTFDETPAFPFTQFKLNFSGGARAALVTPSRCGTYSPFTDFTPWSTPFTGDVFPQSSFQIDTGTGGTACPGGQLPFAPELIAGATTDQAGGYTDFSLLLRRGDGQQRIDGLQFKAPAGLTGELSKVPLCSNAQAEQGEAGECPAASKIGHTVVESGPGPYPLVVPEPGQEPAPIYLTGPYNGTGACTPGEAGCAPFGLSIVVPLHVGPFVLKTQRVRAKIEINPTTAALTVTTNPLPQEVAGVPTDLREVDAVIEHEDFMVNPTSCNPSSFSGTAYGTPPPGQDEPNSSAAISSHFQVGSCQSLKFEPKFSVSTSAQDNFNNLGADLIAKVSYPNVPQGTDADIARFKVELPLALPSRLTTLQKACVNKVFEENPAKCPHESFIGHAVVQTPLLPGVGGNLSGPAVFVSHGGEAFPSLTLVLQGDGVTVDIVGTTFISHTGITSTTFKTVPDAPFNTFELTLPKGKFSALAANTNICKPVKTETVKKKVEVKVHGKTKTVTKKVSEQVAAPLLMPTEIVAQNGAQIHESTKIAVTGCPKPHKAKAKKPRKRRKG